MYLLVPCLQWRFWFLGAIGKTVRQRQDSLNPRFGDLTSGFPVNLEPLVPKMQLTVHMNFPKVVIKQIVNKYYHNLVIFCSFYFV